MRWSLRGAYFIDEAIGLPVHVLLDLDGTLVDTNANKFDAIKCGRDRNFALSDVPLVPGATDVVAAIKNCGHSVSIISDSHAAYVGPISEKVFETPWLALADKPNTAKLRTFLENEFEFGLRSLPEEFLFVGDTRLDVQLARGLSLPSALIFHGMDDVPHDPYHNEETAWARRYMEGATYTCRSFEEVLRVIESPATQRLVLEDPLGTAAARLYNGRNLNDGYTLVRGLGRQQQGPCDAYGAIRRYYRFGSEDRDDNFLSRIAGDIERYLRSEVLTHDFVRWDMITCVADKATTKPPRKMAKLLHALDVGLPKDELFKWSSDVTGSIRQEKKRAGRMSFIRQFVSLESRSDLKDKSVIVIDDQYTTGATAMSHVDMLLDAGVRNVLFLALFYLTEEVPIEKICPRCGKPTRIKYRKRDGAPFYSCVPPDYNGDGCGWMGNITHG
jgi:phosphoglycolate phosphatase-like HAD superfamily hydrolase